MEQEVIAVIGSNGKTGVRVLNKLEDSGYVTRGLSRSTEIPFDWTKRETWGEALEGVHSVYVTYVPDLAVPQAEEDIKAFVGLAKEKQIKHVVLLSGRGEEGAQRAEMVVKESGLTWNIIRASWFMQNFSESFMLDGIQSGELILPEAKALEPFIDVDDIADVVVAALTRIDLNNQLLEITGPEMLTFDDCVKAIAEVTNQSIVYKGVPVEVYLAGAKAQGIPDDMAWLIKELFVNVLDGRNEWTTNTVEKVLGRSAKNFGAYVERTFKSGVWSISN
ncbi:NAD(P)H-binding protein [Thiomicrorhabdus indica]|uniref:NmrA family NAD(P)-binding protein n=1 Tax=Thiomicrorhabdus indica TaxID=2267253 RepID=UPI002AA9492F|nr:NAD(P)H-binding protein [Thiomicrorhabdus indica]